LPPGEESESVRTIRPGEVLKAGTRFIQAPEAGRDLGRLFDAFMAFIDRSGLPAVMYGHGPSGSSGYNTSSLQTAAQIVYRPTVQQAAAALENMLAMKYRCLEQRYPEGVVVYGRGEKEGQSAWLKVKKENVDGYHNFEVSIQPLLPIDKIQQRDSIIRLKEAGLWSKRRSMEDPAVGVDDPEAEQKQILVERFRESTPIAGKLMEDAAKEEGLIDDTQEPPAGSAPLGGPPPSGLVGPNGMPLGPAGSASPEALAAGAQGPMVPPLPGVGMPLVPTSPGGAL